MREGGARRLADIARQAGAADPEIPGERLVLLFDGAAARGAVLDSGHAAAARAQGSAESLIDAALADAGPASA